MSYVPQTTAEFAKESYLSVEQREELERHIQGLEWALKGRSMDDGSPYFSRGDVVENPEILQESLTRDRQMLLRGTPPPMSVAEKNRVFREMKQLQAEITEDMPSIEMMERPLPQHIDHHLAWQEANLEKILAWKSMRRSLDPDNDSPNFINIEILRTNDPPKGDPRRYWKNFDAIAWDTTVEETIAIVDHSTYLEFLQLKALDWSEANICRKLYWGKEQYSQAMERLRRATGVPASGVQASFSPESPSVESKNSLESFVRGPESTPKTGPGSSSLTPDSETPDSETLLTPDSGQGFGTVDRVESPDDDPIGWIRQKIEQHKALSYHALGTVTGIPRRSIQAYVQGENAMPQERWEAVKKAVWLYEIDPEEFELKRNRRRRQKRSQRLAHTRKTREKGHKQDLTVLRYQAEEDVARDLGRASQSKAFEQALKGESDDDDRV